MLARKFAKELVALSYAEQERLIARALKEEVDLYDLLEAEGLSLDDLTYSDSRTRTWSGGAPVDLRSFEKVGKGIPVVSFFTGCGGMDLGLEALGFENVAAFEHNEIFCRTLRKNRPQWNVFGPPFHDGDVSKVEDVIATLEPLIQKPFEGLFVGGPPCQPFSIAANQRFAKWGDNFKRVGFDHAKNGNLLFDFVALIKEFRPAAFLIENVPGLRDIDGGEQLSVAIKQLEDAGYEVAEPSVFEAADYGVPQYRQRMFVVGSRTGGKFVIPEAQEHVGCGSVLDVLPGHNVPNHETRKHKAGSLQRYMVLGYGQRDQLGRVDRLDPTRPSKTVIAGGTNGGGRSHLHHEIPRTLSVRECARLQTFPDDYVFVGPTARQFTQVGNAVPPVLAATVGTALVKAFF
ncbi:DNA cytosine methyltransferase [Sandaracinobacter neustonicus]|uniref:DNA (cytosine-5-)-methyltransferase n=2 Tax=Sphingomonadales TaxID=204457 RepID=A0A501XG08_9SPHN|nr:MULTISPECIES: DNA cytosine methyltransferase [Sphingomonadales]MXO62516.1 DNA (cytosine-5-)-methyltransferase [Qipengyuania oceanensis]TPE59476.1 DNA cytosine methyltransferase [Sandaracinobacter neustonicus]